MSTPDALAAVTAIIRSRLVRAVSDAGLSTSVGGAVTVSATAPNRIDTDSSEPNSVNVFLHRLTRHAAWTNQTGPHRDGSGRRVASTPVPVDAHYIVTSYGQAALGMEFLLGHAAVVLLDNPFFERDEIRDNLPPTDASLPAALAGVRLADQLDRVRISDANPGTEEISRLWSSFQAAYRPSLFLEVGPILLQRERSVSPPLPVRFVGVGTTAADIPTVATVTADGDELAPITTGATLVITGTQLVGDGTIVRLGGSTAAPATARATELTVPLAAFAPPVMPGVHGLVVTHERMLGIPPTPHVGITSAAVVVPVEPTVTIGPNAVNAGTITVEVTPAVGPDQDVILQLSEVGAAPGTEPAGATVRAAVRTTPATSIAFPVAGIDAGSYVARVVVDGVASSLTLGASGVYDEPSVAIP